MRLLPALLLSCLLALQPAWGRELTLHIGNHAIRAEVADTPQSRARGLMQRDHLCADCGMLFIFEKADKHDFWMKNTPLPLSIAFISADGSIINIEEMQPNTTTLHSAQGDALFALEMNSGWFSMSGVKPNDSVHGLKPKPEQADSN